MRSPRGQTLAVALVLTVGGLIAPAAVAAADPVIVGAGDIASCSATADSATAKLLDGITGTVVALGDNAYPSGTAAQFRDCYAPTWGRHKARTRPAAGNHDYETAGAKGYFGYFGAAAGDPAKGYYSYDLGTWHIVVLNSNCAAIGGCSATSPQGGWLRADLAANRGKDVLAYWHHPRFSSGVHGNAPSLQRLLGDPLRRGRRRHPQRSRPRLRAVRAGRTHGAAPTPRTGSASSSSAPAAPSCVRAPRPPRTARSSHRPPAS